MHDVAEVLKRAVTDIRARALRPHAVEDEDLAVEPVPALVELYSSTTRPTQAPNEPEKGRGDDLVIGTHRNITLTRFAGRFRRSGMEDGEIRAALLKINENRCDPPLPEWEVEKISRSMMRYEPEDPVLKDPAILSATGVGVPAERKLRFVTAKEISEQTPEEVEWLVPPYIARGAITGIDGKPKAAGKTTLVSHMVKAVVNGQEFLGEPTTKTGVVYLTEQSEGTFRVVLDRVDLLGREDLTVLHWVETIGFGWDEVVRAAAKEAVDRGAGMLVVDTLPQFARLKGDAENNAGAALAAIQPLQEAAAVHNLGVIVVRHERKSGGDVGDSARGSSAIAGAVDIILSVRRTEGNGNANVRTIHTLSRFDETPQVQVVELTAHGYEQRGEGTALTAINARAKMLEILPTSGPGMTLDQIRETTRFGRTTIQTELRRMANDSEVVEEGEGVRGSPYSYWRPVVPRGLEDGASPQGILSAGTPSLGVTETEDLVEAENSEGSQDVEEMLDDVVRLNPEVLYDEDDEQFDPARIDRIRKVVQENWNFWYQDPQKLIDEGVFYGLGFKPSRAEVEEAQRPFVESIG